MTQRRSSVAEYHERIEFVRKLLVQRHPKYTIKKLVRLKYGADLSYVSIEGYLTRARELLIEVLDEKRRPHRAKALAFYESILNDPKTTARDKIKAQARIDKLLGLESPQRHVVGNDPKRPLPSPILRMVVPAAEAADTTTSSNGHLNGHA